MNLQCVYRHGLFSCARYGGCVCLCRAVVQGMLAVFAFVVQLYKVWWLCSPLSCGCTRYRGCVCLCHVVVQGAVAVFAFAITVRWPLDRSCSGHGLFNVGR